MKPFLMALLLLAGTAHADRRLPDVEVDVPPEVFTSSGQREQPCNQCCIYDDKNYSEGAVIKTEGLLLQCGRDPHVVGTNPLSWQRVKP